MANPGPHGFSEILYEFTSAAANNGSGFEGLGDNNPAWNIATGIVLLLGRFPALVLPLALAGFLAAKKRVPQTTGTLRTDNLTFAGMLLGTVLLVGALSFMPAVVLGPIADHLLVDQALGAGRIGPPGASPGERTAGFNDSGEESGDDSTYPVRPAGRSSADTSASETRAGSRQSRGLAFRKSSPMSCLMLHEPIVAYRN